MRIERAVVVSHLRRVDWALQYCVLGCGSKSVRLLRKMDIWWEEAVGGICSTCGIFGGFGYCVLRLRVRLVPLGRENRF